VPHLFLSRNIEGGHNAWAAAAVVGAEPSAHSSPGGDEEQPPPPTPQGRTRSTSARSMMKQSAQKVHLLVRSVTPLPRRADGGWVAVNQWLLSAEAAKQRPVEVQVEVVSERALCCWA
jgi:hypothetical protein